MSFTLHHDLMWTEGDIYIYIYIYIFSYMLNPGLMSFTLNLGLMWKKWDPIKYYFYYTFFVDLSWPEDGRSRSKHVTKYNLIVIIASCLMYVVYWRCVMYSTVFQYAKSCWQLKTTHHQQYRQSQQGKSA